VNTTEPPDITERSSGAVCKSSDAQGHRPIRLRCIRVSTAELHDPQGWRKEGRDLMRAIAGGAIVGMPLLYTMEMWQHGMVLSEWHLLMLLGATLLVNFVFSYLSGFRRECTVPGAAMESVTAVGIAIVFSAVVLWLIGEIQFAMSAAEIIGKVFVEAAAVSIGISFASAQVEGRSRTGENNGQAAHNSGGLAETPNERNLSPSDRQLRADLREFAAALAGSTVFALNVAPTEEITVIAGRLSPLQLLGVLGTSTLLCYVILFASEFREHRVHEETLFQHPVSETILTCAVSLGVAAALLVLLGERSLLSHPATFAAGIVTLGLPAMVGGAAGRLIA
jgi:putative integral membrane protein (TIGR02587 family)